MSLDAYKLTTINLFEDLKDTNIRNEEFKQILSSYDKLSSYYVKTNQTDLYKDLEKQKEVLFSYIPSFKKQTIKKVASLFNKLEAEVGNIDEIDTCETPDKQVQFVKVAYNNGKWTISAHNFRGTEFTNKETPQAIGCLVNLAGRLDEQEAAYALCHAKKAGLFTMAELPYVRTDEKANTALEQKYIKDPGTTLGPVERSWESSMDNANMPVSRQFASEDDVKEGDTYEDKDGDTYTVSTVSGDAIITFDNSIFKKEEVDEKIKNGSWTKINASSDEDRIAEIKAEIEELTKGAIREEQLELEVQQRLLDEYQEKINNMQESKLEKLRDTQDETLIEVKKGEYVPLKEKIRLLADELDRLTLNNSKIERNLQRMKFQTSKGVVVKHSIPVENFKTKMVTVEEAQELLEALQARYGKKNQKLFAELTKGLFKQVSAAENFGFGYGRTPENEREVNKRMDKYRNRLKSSQNSVIIKSAAYKELDNMLVDGYINFQQYNTLCDFAETDAKTTMVAIKDIKAHLYRPVQAGSLGDIADKVMDWLASVKSWFTEKISFVSLCDKQTEDINEQLEKFVTEGE